MSSSVNVPTNPKIKEQDVNAKLQLYGIYSGMLSPNGLFAGPVALVAITEHKLTRDCSLCQWQGPFGQYRRKRS
jgi:hypothetical protein